MIMVFVNFVFSNIVFTHTHKDSSFGTITHSHPYNPGAGHGHSQASFDKIAGFNTAVSSFQGSGMCDVPAPVTSARSRGTIVRTTLWNGFDNFVSLRGPPAGIFDE